MRTGDIVKVGFAVVTLVGAMVAFIVFNPFGPPVDLPKRVVLVDVQTGGLYQINTNKYTIVPPLRSPETAKLSLVPVTFDDENNRWLITQRYMALLNRIEVEPDAVESYNTGFVKTLNSNPKTIEPQY